MEPKPLYGALTVYRERGAYLRRLEQFEKAKIAYDEAFKTNPEDVRLLIGRSQVCSDAVKPQQAMADAELAAKLEPDNCTARNMQALAFYTMSEFERSLVRNYRGSQLRKQPPYFLEGISQGLETLQDCVGTNAGQVLLDFLPFIKLRQDIGSLAKDDEEPKTRPRVSRIPYPKLQRMLTNVEARKEKVLSRVLAMKYIGPMAYDKFFLQELALDPRIKGANAKGSQMLANIVDVALHTLTERQEMLRSQRPYYTIKLAEKSVSNYQNKYLKEMLITDQKTNTHTAERLIRAIDKSMRANQIQDMMAKAQRMQIFLDSKTPRTLPSKELFTDRLYRTVGEGYLRQYRLSYRLSERTQRRRIAILMGMRVGRPSSYDSVEANLPRRFADIKQAIEKVAANVDTCENPYMKCWMMYELAILQVSQKNYAFSKFYAKRCQRLAQELENLTWWLNGCFALISGDMQQGNTHEVELLVEEALAYININTKTSQDREQVVVFLRKCLEAAQLVVMPDDITVNKQREREILRVMDEETRVETEVLFRRMARVPAGRRFAVLPRKAGAASMVSARQKRRQRGLSVVPGPVEYLKAPPKSDVTGFQVFDI